MVQHVSAQVIKTPFPDRAKCHTSSDASGQLQKKGEHVHVGQGPAAGLALASGLALEASDQLSRAAKRGVNLTSCWAARGEAGAKLSALAMYANFSAMLKN